jgi:hypothetical protein
MAATRVACASAGSARISAVWARRYNKGSSQPSSPGPPRRRRADHADARDALATPVVGGDLFQHLLAERVGIAGGGGVGRVHGKVVQAEGSHAKVVAEGVDGTGAHHPADALGGRRLVDAKAAGAVGVKDVHAAAHGRVRDGRQMDDALHAAQGGAQGLVIEDVTDLISAPGMVCPRCARTHAPGGMGHNAPRRPPTLPVLQ